MKQTDYPWVLFNLGKNVFGISSEFIESIFISARTTPVPEMPDFVKGLFNLRGKIIHIIDLRKYMGMKSMDEETNEVLDMLEKRKREHIHWIDALEESIHEKTEFKLATDPHACAFGKWYDSYEAGDNMTDYLLKRFDEPHKQIHALAQKVKKLEETGAYTEAQNLIDQTKDYELKSMIDLFEAFGEEYRESRRELIMVLENDNELFGITVDSVLSIESIDQENIAKVDHPLFKTGMDMRIGKRQEDDTPIFLIEDLHFE